MKFILLLIITINFALASGDDFDDFDDFEDEFAVHEKVMNEIYDPLYGYNNWMTGVNDFMMINMVEPSVTGYSWVIPEQGRTSINNAFKNIYFPVSFVNNALQLKPEGTEQEMSRFLINSTLGLFGLFDVADSWFDIKPHVEDFGQTLGHYGVGPGFPVVLPFFGQNNLRDLFGSVTDAFIDPVYYHNGKSTSTAKDNFISVMIKGYDDFNEYSLTPGAYEKITKDSIDLYPFIRDAYEQNRNQLIKE